MSRFMRVARLIELMNVIKHHPDWGPKKLAKYFEISEKRIFDDLNELNAANIPIVYNGAGYSFLSTVALPPLQFTLDEALALLMSTKTLTHQKGTCYSRSARSAAVKLLDLFSQEVRKHVMDLDGKISFETKGATETRESLKTINEAVVNRNVISMLYYSYSSRRTTKRDIEPYALFFRGNAWYVMGKCRLRGEIRTFRVNRIKRLTPTDEKFVYPDGFSVIKKLEKSWSVFSGEDETEVVVKFSPRIAPLIEEHKWQPDQKITKHADGSITFSTVVSGTLEIRRWILSWGDDARVLKPQSLKDEIRRTAAAVSAR
ncbi:MAG: WYL domain-containing protein [bacterium]